MKDFTHYLTEHVLHKFSLSDSLKETLKYGSKEIQTGFFTGMVLDLVLNDLVKYITSLDYKESKEKTEELQYVYEIYFGMSLLQKMHFLLQSEK